MKRALVLIAAAEAVAIVVVSALMMGELMKLRPGLTPRGLLAEAQPDEGAKSTSTRPATAEPLESPPQSTSMRASDPDPLLHDTIVLYGKIRSKTGSVIEGLSGSFTQGAREYDSLTLSKRGDYAATGLRAGTLSLWLNATGHHSLVTTIELDGRASAVRRDFVLEPATVLPVRLVTLDGTPLTVAFQRIEGRPDRLDASIGVIATKKPPEEDLPPTMNTLYRAGVGRWVSSREREGALPSGVDGHLQINDDLPVWASVLFRHMVLDTCEVNSDATEIVLKVDPSRIMASLGNVRLKVVDAQTGNALTEARVALNDAQTGGGGRPPDEDGNVVFERVRPGKLSLEVESAQYEVVRQAVMLEPGADLDLGTLALHPRTTILGKVVDESGSGLANVGVRVVLLNDAHAQEAFDSRIGTSTGPDGTFTIGWTGRRQYIVLFRARGKGVAAVKADATEGTCEAPLVTLRDGVPVALVRSADTAFDSYRLVDSSGIPLEFTDVREANHLSLAPGSYRIELFENDQRIDARSLEVGRQALTVTL